LNVLDPCYVQILRPGFIVRIPFQKIQLAIADEQNTATTIVEAFQLESDITGGEVRRRCTREIIGHGKVGEEANTREFAQGNGGSGILLAKDGKNRVISLQEKRHQMLFKFFLAEFHDGPVITAFWACYFSKRKSLGVNFYSLSRVMIQATWG